MTSKSENGATPSPSSGGRRPWGERRVGGFVGRRPKAAVATLTLLIGCGLHFGPWDIGLRGDDFVHRAMVRGSFPASRAPWDLFSFAGPTATDRLALRRSGYLPYWASEDLSLAMLRPVSSLLTYADHWLLPDQPVAYHVHSFLWWCALLAAATWLLASWLGVGAAVIPRAVSAYAIAAILFCINDSHTTPIHWLANRSGLVALTFGCLALGCQERHWGSCTHRWSLASAIALCACLAAGEYGLGIVGYAVVGTLGAPVASHRRMGHGLLSLVLPTAGYLGIRAALGFGVRSSGYYLSLLNDPLQSALTACVRYGVLAGDLWLGIPASWSSGSHPFRRPLLSALSPNHLDLYRSLPSAQTVQACAGAVVVVALALRTAGRIRSLGFADREAQLIVGSLAALVPFTGSLPESRLLQAGALGQAALLGLWAGRLLTRPRPATGPQVWGLTAIALLHVVVPTSVSLAKRSAIADSARRERSVATDAEFPSVNVSETRVYVTAAPDFLTAANLPYARSFLGLSVPSSYQRLSAALAPMELTRSADNQLELKTLVMQVGNTMTGSLYRPQNRPLHDGQVLSAPGLQVEVLATTAGNPRHLRLTFEHSLDDARVWITHPMAGRLRHLVVPAPGHSIRLPAPRYDSPSQDAP